VGQKQLFDLKTVLSHIKDAKAVKPELTYRIIGRIADDSVIVFETQAGTTVSFSISDIIGERKTEKQ